MAFQTRREEEKKTSPGGHVDTAKAMPRPCRPTISHAENIRAKVPQVKRRPPRLSGSAGAAIRSRRTAPIHVLHLRASHPERCHVRDVPCRHGADRGRFAQYYHLWFLFACTTSMWLQVIARHQRNQTKIQRRTFISCRPMFLFESNANDFNSQPYFSQRQEN